MCLKKYYKIIIAVCTLILIFDISYCLNLTKNFSKSGGMSFYKKNKMMDTKDESTLRNGDAHSAENGEKAVNSYDSYDNEDKVISESAKIIYKIKYTNTHDFVVENIEDAKPLAGMKKNDIEKSCKDKGYYLESINENEIICLKDAKRYAYERGKYVLGINNAYPAIYKINDDGKMAFIENSKNLFGDKAKKMNDFSKSFYDELMYGNSEIQFDTLDEAENMLSADNS